MIDIIVLTQNTLDAALRKIPIYSYWNRRQEIDEDPNPDEYIVYSMTEHDPISGADGCGLIYKSYITLRYFVREEWIGDAEKYPKIRQHMDAIRAAMIAGGFDCTSGWQDVGDIDGISFSTWILSVEYSEVDRGDS